MFGDSNDYKVSFQLSIPSKTGSAGESSEASSESDTVIDMIEAQSMESAINLANRLYKQKAKPFSL